MASIARFTALCVGTESLAGEGVLEVEATEITSAIIHSWHVDDLTM